jgi:hypothetical protein
MHKSSPVSGMTYAKPSHWKVVVNWMWDMVFNSIKEKEKDGRLEMIGHFHALRLLHLWFKKQKVVNVSQIQLMACASMLTACAHDHYTCTLDYLVRWSAHSFTREDLQRAQLKLLDICEWRIHNYLSPYDILVRDGLVTQSSMARLHEATLDEAYLTRDQEEVARSVTK